MKNLKELSLEQYQVILVVTLLVVLVRGLANKL